MFFVVDVVVLCLSCVSLVVCSVILLVHLVRFAWIDFASAGPMFSICVFFLCVFVFLVLIFLWLEFLSGWDFQIMQSSVQGDLFQKKVAPPILAMYFSRLAASTFDNLTIWRRHNAPPQQ